ncbi:G-rich sequence factor 1-like [Micractinium conductrix]|uniref:G-rich sequence factor 1-like n=1 Tax=Micractinium conductrix TaxID=554055 RepID=A0A2P6VLM7_9CHLO|nr:G-rich sequence factor 1-like [Micractinium conductrix]|eukprot:PSC74988.1 G-rich sequence factor 1-like [Micractinium conductrix]
MWPEYSWGSCQVPRYWLTFSSEEARERGIARNLAYLGTRRALVRLAQPQEFAKATHNPVATPSAGRFVLVTGLSPTCYNEDLAHFFRGYDLLPQAIFFMRDAEGEHGRGRAWNSGGGSRADAAVVRFASPLEARCAVRSLQQGHVSGSTVRLRVLE